MLRALALRARTRSLPRSVRRLHLVQFSVAGGNNANGRTDEGTDDDGGGVEGGRGSPSLVQSRPAGGRA